MRELKDLCDKTMHDELVSIKKHNYEDMSCFQFVFHFVKKFFKNLFSFW